jgi:antitoxin HicB
MKKKNPHIGSSFESWLDEEGIREEVTAAAVKSVIAQQIALEMKKLHITKARMATLMETSRAQVDRLLDPDNGSATLETLMRAARIVGRELRLELVRPMTKKTDPRPRLDEELLEMAESGVLSEAMAEEITMRVIARKASRRVGLTAELPDEWSDAVRKAKVSDESDIK